MALSVCTSVWLLSTTNSSFPARPFYVIFDIVQIALNEHLNLHVRL